MRSRSRRWAFAALTLGLGVMMALFVAEVILRLAGIGAPQFYAYDAERGVRHRPGAEGLYRGDGEALVRINSAGLRSPERPVAKPAGTLRIAVLGDSFAEAFGVPQEQTFWSVMERELASCDGVRGRPVEVINFGVSGYGTSAEWITLQREGWAFEPDVVLLTFFGGNDLRNNVPELEREPYRLYHVLRDGALVTVRPAGALSAAMHGAGTRLWRAMADLSHVVQLLNQARRWLVTRQAQAEGKAVSGTTVGLEAGVDIPALSAPRDATWQQAWQVTEAVLRALAAEVRQHGRLLHIASVSHAVQVHPQLQVRQGFMQSLGLDRLDYADVRVEALAREIGVDFTALAPPLQAWAEQHGRCVHGFDNATPCYGHWNVDGHRLVGVALARNVCLQLGRTDR
jgi:GDSL-like Lipase/Acylhydrolase family